MKIIHITDPHLVPEGETIFGLDPAARFKAVIDDVARRHPDADLTIVTGDLVDRGDEISYKLLMSLLEPLRMPVRLLLGNHDSRVTFAGLFPDAPRDEDGFVQSVLDLPNGEGRLLFLDTNEPGWSGGRYCDRRLAWLETRLAEAPDQQAYIFMHHPPFGLGVPHFEKICLSDPEPFLGALRQHKAGVRHIFFGHVHIPVSGVSPEGIPFTAGRGCNHQIILDLAGRNCTWAGGGPNYNIIVIERSAMFVHAFDLIGAAIIGTGAYPPGP